MKKSKWKYATAPGTLCGIMICNVCGREILEGDFRYKEQYHRFDFLGFVSHQHKGCAPKGDPEWQKLETEAAAESRAVSLRLAAFKEFAKKWGTPSLNNDIEDMEISLQND